jgi:hypothetical protein
MRYGQLPYVCVFSGVLFLLGCDRIRESMPLAQPAVTSTELSMDTLIEHMVEHSKQSVDEAHKKGETNTVGLVDGKKWQEGSFDRYDYIKGVADLFSATIGVAGVVLDKANDRDAQLDRKNQSTSTAALDAMRILAIRIADVVSVRSYGDTVDAITKFYSDKPLLKDRPVIWVIAVPLYKQIQEAKPPEERDNKNETIPVPIKATQKGKKA